MDDLADKKKLGKKVYRGAYEYKRNDNIYSEETFEVFKDKKDTGLYFVSQIISRVSTGELLNVNINYYVNKNFIPLSVKIEKTLGNQHVEEVFTFNSKTNKLTYVFKDQNGEHESEISTPPKFTISCPSVCTSMLCLRQKKVDTTSKSFFTLFVSQNMWDYEHELESKSIAVQKVTQSPEKLTLDGQNVNAIQYKLYQQLEEGSDEPGADDFLRAYVSPHATLPYVIRGEDGTKIQIKYMNNLTDSEV